MAGVRLPIDAIAGGCALDYTASAAEPTERVQNGDFLSATGWDTAGVAWTISLGTALNNTAGQFLTNTLTSPILAGQSVTATVVVTDNPNAVTWMISMYNTITLASQNILSEGGGSPGTYTNGVEVVALADYDAIRIRAIADPGLLLDSVSVLA